MALSFTSTPVSAFRCTQAAPYAVDLRLEESRQRKMLYTQLHVSSTWEYESPATGQLPQPVRDPGFITDLDFAPDGRYLVASCTNKEVYIFNCHNGRLLNRFEKAHNDAVSRVRFVSDFHFVSGSVDGTMVLWDIRKQGTELGKLIGHTKPIRSIDYDRNLDWIISSAQDGQVRFWYLPSIGGQVEHSLAGANEDNSPYRGILLTCPNFNQACLGPKALVLCKDASSTIFVIENLDLLHMREDLKNKRLDESFKFQMSWFTPNASPTKRNRIRVFECEDYSPVVGATVSSVSHLTFHPYLPLLLLRLTTNRRVSFRQELKDWICVCTLQETYRQYSHQASNMGFLMTGFGSNIIDETLLFQSEEERFASFREKRVSFSNCGRLIASPSKFGVRVMSFSKEMHSIDELLILKKSITAGSMWPINPLGPAELLTCCSIERPVGSTICCKFSPTDTILAAGDSNNQISFCQPVLS